MKKVIQTAIWVCAILVWIVPIQNVMAGTGHIQVPSDAESTIAPGRSFYISGTFQDYTYEEGDQITVCVYEQGSSETKRKIQSNIKDNPHLKIEQNNGFPSFYDGVTDADILLSGMPDLIFDEASENVTNGDIKCHFNENQFAALIPGGGELPMGMTDIMQLKDTARQPYSPLEPGDYQIVVEIVTKSGDVSVKVEKPLHIGVSADKILSRFSPNTHLNAVQEFAKGKEYRIYNDPFPGYWNFTDGEGNDKFCEIAPEWRLADATEYTAGKVHFIIYNVKSSSTTYGVELGLLQNLGDVNNPERLVNYYYSTGEPGDVNGFKGAITAFAPDDKMALVRAEISTSPDEDGIYDEDNLKAESYDMDISDGVQTHIGNTISFYGVTAPIQIAKTDITANPNNTYQLNNKIKTITYHITGDGIDENLSKDVVLNRKNGNKTNPSELEFKHNLFIAENMAGKTLRIEANGYDAHGTLVHGTNEIFDITVAATANPKEEETKDSSVQPPLPTHKEIPGKSPKTHDSNLPVIFIFLTIASGALGVKIYYQMHL